MTDTGAIEAAVDAVVAANPDKAEQAKAKPGMLGWFVGQVMKSDRRQGQSAGRQRRVEDATRPSSSPRIDSLRFARFAANRSARRAQILRVVATKIRQLLPRKIRSRHAIAMRRFATRERVSRDAPAPR